MHTLYIVHKHTTILRKMSSLFLYSSKKFPRIAGFDKLVFILPMCFLSLVVLLFLNSIPVFDFLDKKISHFLAYNHIETPLAPWPLKRSLACFFVVILCNSHWAILSFYLFLVLLSCSQDFKSTIRSLLNLKYISFTTQLILIILYFLHCLHVPPFSLCKDWL